MRHPAVIARTVNSLVVAHALACGGSLARGARARSDSEFMSRPRAERFASSRRLSPTFAVIDVLHKTAGILRQPVRRAMCDEQCPTCGARGRTMRRVDLHQRPGCYDETEPG